MDGGPSGLEPPSFEPPFGDLVGLAQSGGPAPRHGRPNVVAQAGTTGLDSSATAAACCGQSHAPEAYASGGTACPGVANHPRARRAGPPDPHGSEQTRIQPAWPL